MKLWVDDERPAPDGWTWIKNSFAAIQALKIYGSWIAEMSLDHDLGGDDTTRPIALWMAEHNEWPQIIRVHTANPVGREWLEGMVNRYGPGVTR